MYNVLNRQQDQTQTQTQGIYANSSISNTVFAIMSTVLLGTGSAYAMDSHEKWRKHLQPRVTFLFDKNTLPVDAPQRIDARTPAEHIANIRSVFNPSISDLANLFDISRQAVYKWLSYKSTPDQEKLKQLIELSHIADKFRNAEIFRSDSVLKMKAFNGLSLLDILKSGKDYSAQIDMLISEAKAMEESYKRSGIASSKTKPTNDWKASISIPGSHEEV